MPDYYEFFAGGGMVRAGLGEQWTCRFANDFDQKKSRMYHENWGVPSEIEKRAKELKTADIKTITTRDIPEKAHLAWASFPCQDLSLAGGGAGLKGDRSGTFWPFWKLMESLRDEQRAPRLIVLENVCGTLTSHEGKDFSTICSSFEKAGYSVGAVVVDAALFVPQSRPRLFVVGVHHDMTIPASLIAKGPQSPWHTRALKGAYGKLPEKVKKAWQWWNLPLPAKRERTLSDIIEENPADTQWFSAAGTRELLDMMSEINRAKVVQARSEGRRIVGGVYKRTRPDVSGQKVQRAEVRFDDISGCLRTPAGGSSRQVIVVVEGRSVKARLISARETARLMGLDETYILPENYNEAYHLTGDGVVVPVVRHLAEHIFEPILAASEIAATVAA